MYNMSSSEEPKLFQILDFAEFAVLLTLRS